MAHIDDEHFKHFAVQLEKAIDKWGDTPEDDLLARQKKQVEKLAGLEKEFRKTLIKHPWGNGVYKSFIEMIRDQERSILAARPYFRERQSVFTAKIAKALDLRNEKSLYKFHFNYRFVIFVLRSRKWPKNSKLRLIAKEIENIRQEIVEMNMPLAISRARIFWSKTPKAQLTYMDLIQISCEGLISAVDKFCLPFSKIFRSVAIGRIVGNFIEQYSETLVHFYPVDKRKIYRANKAASRMNGGVRELDFEKLAEIVNKDVDKNHRTTPSEIADLMAASSCLHVETSSNSEENEAPVDGAPSLVRGLTAEKFAADESWRPDVKFEQMDSIRALTQAMDQLNLVERKLLKMYGVTL